MGDEAAAGEWMLRARAAAAGAHAAVARRPAEVARSRRATTLEHWTDGPGVYRVEAYLHAHGRERTWILSNPIYLR